MKGKVLEEVLLKEGWSDWGNLWSEDPAFYLGKASAASNPIPLILSSIPYLGHGVFNSQLCIVFAFCWHELFWEGLPLKYKEKCRSVFSLSVFCFWAGCLHLKQLEDFSHQVALIKKNDSAKDTAAAEAMLPNPTNVWGVLQMFISCNALIENIC